MSTALNHDVSPAEEPPAWTERAVLVYGPRKAGTTLFLNLLDGGEGLFVFPGELKLKFLHASPDGLVDRYRRELLVPTLKVDETIKTAYGRLWEAAGAAAGGATIRELMRLDAWFLQRSVGHSLSPRQWCAKEVGGDTGAIVALWRSAFPHGKLIFIVRDPLMTVRAVLQDRRRKGIRLSLRRIARETYDPLRVLRCQARFLGEPRIHLVAYERLVADTAGVMGAVAAFLGIRYTRALLRPTVFGAPVIVATASRPIETVFRSRARWFDGLPWRERLVVGVTFAALSLVPVYRLALTRLGTATGVTAPSEADDARTLARELSPG